MEERKKVIWAGVLFLVLIAIGVAVYYFLVYQKPEQVKEIPEAVEKPMPQKETIEPEKKEIEIIQVELDDSDSVVRDLAEKLSSHPQLTAWLMTEDLIRKFVAAVDNIANGQSPRPHIDFFHPDDNFRVLKENGQVYIDPECYSRYDSVAEVFTSLDPEGCVELYKRLAPAIQKAYQELGYPEGDFQKTLKTAMAVLLEVPVVEEKMALEKKVVTYEMADPELEGLSPAQKHLLRMGPDNVEKIQTTLREMWEALESP